MVDDAHTDDARSDDGGTLFPRSVGERLLAARVKAGLDLNDIATRTRVPMRHLVAIERGDYASLPSSTYALGFARAYARAIGIDATDLTRDMRAELGRAPPDNGDAAPYEPVDPARLPSRLLAWTTAAIFLIVIIGYASWRSGWFDEAAVPTDVLTQPVAEAPADPSPVAPPAAAPSATAQVLLTATAPVWVRIYDRADKVLFEKEMATGESWPVPPDADTPMIRTGKAQALRVTIDGREVAPLGRPDRTVRDVVISAAVLAARPLLPDSEGSAGDSTVSGANTAAGDLPRL